MSSVSPGHFKHMRKTRVSIYIRRNLGSNILLCGASCCFVFHCIVIVSLCTGSVDYFPSTVEWCCKYALHHHDRLLSPNTIQHRPPAHPLLSLQEHTSTLTYWGWDVAQTTNPPTHISAGTFQYSDLLGLGCSTDHQPTLSYLCRNIPVL